MPMRRWLRKPGTANAPAAPKPSSIQRAKQGAAEVIGAAIEGLAGLGAMVGAPVAALLGKLFLAAILGAVALGVFLRFAGRQRKGEPAPVKIPTPAWVRALAGLASAIEVALLVEATKLPVRHDQPGFTQANWLLVLLAWGVACALQTSWLGAAVARRRRGKPATPTRLP
ncbi:hypothetical protein [Ottowia testudinis]|uniref:Uncharacterized protein n=1 Tax=Ottowia testudinis TaxID=2816950 RepID=A0A975CFF8_9BURK|nr:hypothetical protein [Ottowia testudinis]QTD45425.1 hypothetical protein J1M35_00385 [Ottowia testudinis]